MSSAVEGDVRAQFGQCYDEGMTEADPPPPKPVHITIGPDGQVTALLNGVPVDPDGLLASIQAAAKGEPED